MPELSRHPGPDQRGRVIVQSILLPGSLSESQASEWLEGHGYIFGALEEPSAGGGFWRARQYDPSDFVEGGVEGQDFVTFELPESGGVKLIRGLAKGAKTDQSDAQRRVYRVDAFRFDSFEMVGERMKIRGHMSRTGVQEYGQGDGTIRREQRDASEVFSEESLKSLEAMPVTIGHPERVMLDGKNWKEFSVGITGSRVEPDGDHTSADIWILDSDVQRKVRDRELQELSVGYFAGLDETPGTNERGEHYDARQVDIRGNHLALLPAGHARGGSGCRLMLDSTGDAEFFTESPPSDIPTAPSDGKGNQAKRTDSMKLKLMIGGEEQMVDMPDEAIAAIAEAVANSMQSNKPAPDEGEMDEEDEMGEDKKKMDELRAQLDSEKARADSLQAKLDAYTPERLAQLAEERARLVEDAALVAGKKLDSTKLDDLGLKRLALETAGIKLDGKSDAYINARFDAGVESASRSSQSLASARRQSRGDGQKQDTNLEPDSFEGSIDAAQRVFGG